MQDNKKIKINIQKCNINGKNYRKYLMLNDILYIIYELKKQTPITYIRYEGLKYLENLIEQDLKEV